MSKIIETIKGIDKYKITRITAAIFAILFAAISLMAAVASIQVPGYGIFALVTIIFSGTCTTIVFLYKEPETEEVWDTISKLYECIEAMENNSRKTEADFTTAIAAIDQRMGEIYRIVNAEVEEPAGTFQDGLPQISGGALSAQEDVPTTSEKSEAIEVLRENAKRKKEIREAINPEEPKPEDIKEVKKKGRKAKTAANSK